MGKISNGAEIHSMEFLYFREKTNWFSEEVRPLKPYMHPAKTKYNII